MAIKAVCFDCDGVLVETISSWRIIHEYFGTNSGEMLDRFLRGEVSDAEFMADDIRLWKSVKPKIHRDELMRCYQGVKLMPGARELVEALKARGIYVAIVSAGVDLLIGSIAKLLDVDDWVQTDSNTTMMASCWMMVKFGFLHITKMQWYKNWFAFMVLTRLRSSA